MTNFSGAIQPVISLHGLRALGGPVKLQGRVLLLCCDFGLMPPTYRTGIGALCSLYALRSFLYERVVQAANPRTPEYQLGYVAAFLRECAVDLPVIDAVFIGGDSRQWPDPSGSGRPVAVEQLADISFLSRYDFVVLSYPDPLGLGHGRLEKKILRRSRRSVILNGRGRLLHLTPSTRRMLMRRRFLARTRLVESLLGCFVPPLAGILALVDYIKRRT